MILADNGTRVDLLNQRGDRQDHHHAAARTALAARDGRRPWRLGCGQVEHSRNDRGRPRWRRRHPMPHLNTLLLRQRTAEARGFGADVKLPVLAKLMLAERFLPRLFDQIAAASAADPNGYCDELASLKPREKTARPRRRPRPARPSRARRRLRARKAPPTPARVRCWQSGCHPNRSGHGRRSASVTMLAGEACRPSRWRAGPRSARRCARARACE
jgi:hypothetical protein